MGDEIHLWQVGQGDHLTEIDRGKLNLEGRLQGWLAHDISVLDPGLLVLGIEVETDFGKSIDMLCIDEQANLVIVELKRDKTAREVTAQALDYASWVVDLSSERVMGIAGTHGVGDLAEAFRQKFGVELPETLNSDHRMLIVASQIDADSERIIRYLSDTHGVNINAATFQYFVMPDGSELLARVFLIEPSKVEGNTRTKGSSKRLPILTYAELEALAAEHGVQALYDDAVSAFSLPVLYKHTDRSAIAFDGHYPSGAREVVIRFQPGESNADDGLHYQLYKQRYADLVGRPVDEIEGLVPAGSEIWAYASNGGPDWEGFQGFISDREAIDRIAEPLKLAPHG